MLEIDGIFKKKFIPPLIMVAVTLNSNNIITNLDVKFLDFILRPIIFILGYYKGIDFIYYDNIGYVNEYYNILIAKECGGVKFLLMGITLVVFIMSRQSLTLNESLGFLPIGVLLTYSMTVVANSFRIIMLITIGTKIQGIIHWEALIHQSIGIITYLSCFICLYIVCNILIGSRRYNYEKIS